METAETAIGGLVTAIWSRQTSAFSREVRGCDREVAEQLDDLILGSWSASRIQHKGHPVCKKLTEKARGPLFQPSYTNKNGQWFLLLHLHLYATHDFSNIWCSCLSCLQSFHCLGIVKWMLLLANQPQPNSGRWGVSFNLLQSVGCGRRPTKQKPLKVGLPKRKLHLPTIDFHGLSQFQAGYIDFIGIFPAFWILKP